MNKTRKYFLALMTAMLVFLLAASLYAADPLKTQINGKELDSINDIIAEVNGGNIEISHGQRQREIRIHSQRYTERQCEDFKL